jgi:hypothetical protein
MPEAKRREKLRIWRPGAVNRAGVGARSGKSRVLEEVGRQNSRFSESGHSEINDEGPLPSGTVEKL